MKLLKLVPDNTNIDFMRWRNVALGLQIVLVVVALTLVAVRGLNLGIDFVGGQVVRTTFAQPVNVEELRSRVNALELGDASIQEFGGPQTYQIRLPKPEGGDAAASNAVTQVRQMIIATYPDARVDAGESVSGKVSEELALDGALAIAFAMLGIAMYIWFRFEWQFGVGALLTVPMTLHDFWLLRAQPAASRSQHRRRFWRSSAIPSTTRSSLRRIRENLRSIARWRYPAASTCR